MAKHNAPLYVVDGSIKIYSPTAISGKGSYFRIVYPTPFGPKDTTAKSEQAAKVLAGQIARRSKREGDYEIIQTVAPAEFEFIATMFRLNPMQDILSIVQEISDSGRGGDLIKALNSKEIKNEFHKWGSYLSFRDNDS